MLPGGYIWNQKKLQPGIDFPACFIGSNCKVLKGHQFCWLFFMCFCLRKHNHPLIHAIYNHWVLVPEGAVLMGRNNSIADQGAKIKKNVLEKYSFNRLLETHAHRKHEYDLVFYSISEDKIEWAVFSFVIWEHKYL